MTRCANRCKNSPLPAGMSVETAKTHPRYAHLMAPGAQCEHQDGHEGPHRNGLLFWHDPPVIFVGGKPYDAPDDLVVSEWSD